MATVRHIGFSKFQILVAGRSNSCRDIVFNGFQNGGHPPSCIFKNSNFWIAVIASGGLICITVYNFVKISQTVLEISQFFDFQDGGHPAYRMSKFQTLSIADRVATANKHHHIKFHQNRSHGCRDIKFVFFQNGGPPPSWIILKNLNFSRALVDQRPNICQLARFHQNRPSCFWDMADSFFRMAAVHHHRLVGGAFWDHPRRVLVCICPVQNLVGITAVVSIIQKFEYFACLAWKCLFTLPFGGRFRVKWDIDPMDNFWNFRLSRLWECNNLELTSDEPNCKVTKKTNQKPRETDISRMRRDAPTLAIVMNFWHLHLHYSICLAGRSYNNVSNHGIATLWTTRLSCTVFVLKRVVGDMSP